MTLESLKPAASSEALRALWSADCLDHVESLMLKLSTGSGVDRPGSILRQHLSTGGKRLRARLALGAGEALGVARIELVAWAAACELLHNATLIHDDLQDGDRVRRGEPAAWVRHGMAHAVTAGDLGLILPYRAVEHVSVDDGRRWRLTQALARGAEQVARGQANEGDLLVNRVPVWTDYVRVIEGKTAALFALPVQGAAIIAGCTAEQAEDLAAPFRTLGTLFQIQDDLLDLYGDKGRGEPGGDLYEGKVSALVVAYLRLHPDRSEWLLDLLARPRQEKTAAEVARAIERLREEGALDAVWESLEQIGRQLESHAELQRYSRLHRVAIELASMAMAPIAHVAALRIQ